MTATTHDRSVPLRHEGLLLNSLDDVRDRLNTWTGTAAARRHKILCLSGSDDLLVDPPGSATRLAISDLHPPAEPARLVHDALEDDFDGVSIVVSADGVIAATSSRVHAAIEATLTDLRAQYPVAVLCCYHRNGAGTDHVDMAVSHHLDGLHEQQLTIRRLDDTVHLRGEVDLLNLDVLGAALRAATRARPATVRIDLGLVTFLSAGAAWALCQQTAQFRDHGGQVELHGATPHLARILQLIHPQPPPGLTVVGSGG
jgi:anti-anti-sigma regulatory factor